MQPKFYTDENVHVVIAKGLKKRGIDIITARDAGMLNKEDSTQLFFAKQQNRVIVTHDTDFLELVGNTSHTGLIFFTQQLSIGEAIEAIEQVYLEYSADDLMNTVLFLPARQ
ncbi:MAG TPA: DUF5615 family PIN-like protein [Candidatus Nanoarchaeia archaeon]|nr:DUF5615 family PIN-like protein [Candidatus Nanoarchaeia archaeon]